MSVKNLLREEITEEIGLLSKMEAGSEDYEKTVNGITKLMDRLNEMDKIEMEKEKTEIENEFRVEEQDLKRKQMEDDKKDRFVKNSLTGVSIIGGLAITVWGTLKTFKFEETGTITSQAGRQFINKAINFLKK